MGSLVSLCCVCLLRALGCRVLGSCSRSLMASCGTSQVRNERIDMHFNCCLSLRRFCAVWHAPRRRLPKARSSAQQVTQAWPAGLQTGTLIITEHIIIAPCMHADDHEHMRLCPPTLSGTPFLCLKFARCSQGVLRAATCHTVTRGEGEAPVTVWNIKLQLLRADGLPCMYQRLQPQSCQGLSHTHASLRRQRVFALAGRPDVLLHLLCPATSQLTATLASPYLSTVTYPLPAASTPCLKSVSRQASMQQSTTAHTPHTTYTQHTHTLTFTASPIIRGTVMHTHPHVHPTQNKHPRRFPASWPCCAPAPTTASPSSRATGKVDVPSWAWSCASTCWCCSPRADPSSPHPHPLSCPAGWRSVMRSGTLPSHCRRRGCRSRMCRCGVL